MEKLKNIPKELKREDRFICFNDRKQPIDFITLKPISITRKKNFISYKKALECLENSPKIKGIGFVLGNGSKGNFCGLDIDDCIDANGNVFPEANEIIELLNTYTEISPSGKGIHCIFFAEKSGNNCKIYINDWCKCLELYDKDRYFTLTGNVIKNKNIEYRQKECDEIYNIYFNNSTYTKKVLNIKSSYFYNNYNDLLEYALDNDNVLNSYWFGYRPLKSESENDFALMGKILFWVGYKNIDIAIRYFVESPYAQQKDEKHKRKIFNTNYLRNTAEKIISLNKKECEHE